MRKGNRRQARSTVLTPRLRRLLGQAAKAMQRAYNPYSHFNVGAAVLNADGKVTTGANVENAAYGDTICAERSAILRANAMGRRSYVAVAIIGGPKDGESKEPVAPCGSCRQVLFEASQLAQADLIVVMSNSTMSNVKVRTIGQLLPLAFGPDDLGIDLTEFRKR